DEEERGVPWSFLSPPRLDATRPHGADPCWEIEQKEAHAQANCGSRRTRSIASGGASLGQGADDRSRRSSQRRSRGRSRSSIRSAAMVLRFAFLAGACPSRSGAMGGPSPTTKPASRSAARLEVAPP